MIRPAFARCCPIRGPPMQATICDSSTRRRCGQPDGSWPAKVVGGTFVDLGELAGRDGQRLGNAVRELRTWTERFAALDDFLLHRIGNGPAPAPEVRWAWRRLVSSD